MRSRAGDASLNRAEHYGLAQGGDGVNGGKKFVGHVSLVAGIGDAAHYPVILDLLVVIELVAAGNAAGVEVPEDSDVGGDGRDEISFHDLHVVDVVEQLDVRRVDFVHYGRAPGGAIGHVVLVVHLAVEQLQTNGDVVVFGDLLHAIQTNHGVARALFIRHALAVSREGDDVGHASLRSQRDVFAEGGLDRGVILDAVHRLGDGAASGIAHGADKAVAAGDLPLIDFEVVYAFQADFRPYRTELIDGHLFVAPAAGGLLDPAAGHGGRDLCERRICHSRRGSESE